MHHLESYNHIDIFEKKTNKINLTCFCPLWTNQSLLFNLELFFSVYNETVKNKGKLIVHMKTIHIRTMRLRLNKS